MIGVKCWHAGCMAGAGCGSWAGGVGGRGTARKYGWMAGGGGFGDAVAPGRRGYGLKVLPGRRGG